jgi:hypothetical protein
MKTALALAAGLLGVIIFYYQISEETPLARSKIIEEIESQTALLRAYAQEIKPHIDSVPMPRMYQFWTWDLEKSAGPLHGYVPKSGDIVEWYIADADCTEPDNSCKFELAIRKALTTCIGDVASCSTCDKDGHCPPAEGTSK